VPQIWHLPKVDPVCKIGMGCLSTIRFSFLLHENYYGKIQTLTEPVWRTIVQREPLSAQVHSSAMAILKSVNDVASRYEALALFAFALFLYSSFASCSLNEGDSFNFARALLKFDLVREQPHAPGYPIYVLLGRVLFLLTGDQLAALRWISVVSGALTLVPLYFLARSLHGREIAIPTCLVLMVLPGFWLASEKATTDALSTSLLTLSIALLYMGMRGHSRAIPISCAAYALAVGVRPTNIVFLVLWIFVALRTRRPAIMAFSVLAFVATVSAWLGPVIWVERWDRFLFATRHVYVGTANTDFISARPLGLEPYERMLFAVASIFTFGLGGMLPPVPGLRFPFSSTSIPAYYLLHDIVWLGALLCLSLNFKWTTEKTFMFLWVVPHFVFVYLFGSPIHHRYYLAIFPPLVLLIVSSVANVAKVCRRWLRLSTRTERIMRGVAYLFLILTLVAHTMPLAEKLHREPAPITQLVRYVRASYCPDSTTILVFHEYSAFRMYAPEFRYYHCRKQITENLELLERQHTSEGVLLITGTAYEFLARHPLVLQLEVTKVVEFYLDPRAEIEDHRIALYKVHGARVSHSSA